MSKVRLALSGTLLCLLAALPAAGQRGAPAVPPDPDPEVERKSFQVAEGFEVNLFAADPKLMKPIQMNFDAAGRLWVACSETYPQVKPGQEANDKIVVLEDTDGDGKADKTTVFADGLLIPTGIEPGDGGVYVVDSTDLLHLQDTDGDGKADKRRVVLSGFGTEDTHHLVHTLRWGMDGSLYFNQSIYIHSHVETPHGPRHLNGGGAWQYRTDTGKLEVFLRGLINPWGHHFDRWGQSFLTDGAGGEGINYGMPGAYYPAAVGARKELHGLNPGSPKYCGLEIAGGTHLPEAWRGSLLTNDFRANRVCRFVVTPDGAGYTSREQPELIKTRFAAFRPIDVKMGPDGAIYVADWFNPIIQHGEVDFRDPRRDVTHGRIWRVTAKGRPLARRPDLVGAKTEALLDQLKSPEDWNRHFARRVLQERGAKKVEPALTEWVKMLDAAKAENEPHQLEALWTYQALDVVEPKLLASLLGANDYRVRAAATRVVAAWHDRLANARELLAARVADDHPQVQLEAVRALSQLRTRRAAETALTVLDRPVDKFLDYGLWLTVRELEPYWIPALRNGEFDYGGSVRRLTFALQAVESRDVVKPLADLVKSGKVAKEAEEAVLTLLASLGGPAELSLVFERAVKDATPARQRLALLDALTEAAKQRGTKPAGDLAPAVTLLDTTNEPLRSAAARAVGAWGIDTARPRLVELAGGEKTADDLRQAAFDGLISLGGTASRDACDKLAAEGLLPIRRRALIALTALDVDAAAKRAASVLTALKDAAELAEVYDAFLVRKQGAAALAKALDGQKLPADAAKVGLRSVRATGREAPALTDALTKAGGLTPGPRTLSADEMRQMMADVAKLGDPARGEAVYRRKDQLCLKCHAIGGAGGQVGPDLSSIGASAPVDYLIESLLLPSKAIKENYHALLVNTIDGKLITGVKVRESNAELVVRNAEDKEEAIPRKKLDEVKPSKTSLMPEGLTDPLTRGELLDLVRFMSELGKVGPYSLSKARLARRWQALETTKEAYTQLYRAGFGSPAADEGLVWGPAYSTVAGELPPGDVPRFTIKRGLENSTSQVAFVRCHLDASSAGSVVLRLNTAKGLTLWVGPTPAEVKNEMKLDLPAGLTTLTFALDLDARKEPLRLEVDDPPGGTAKVRLVGGK